jgi:hypothetical protein
MSEFQQRQQKLYEALREQSAKSMEIARKAQEAMQKRYEQVWGKR